MSMQHLEPLMRQNFLEYASYVIMDRAIPDMRDGCKPVQRRILHTLFSVDDGKFHKVANIIGEAMKLHPHGDASIGDALVVLANKEYFIEKQGNFGNVLTGHAAAAARYIECRLTPLAKETLFNKDLTQTQKSYDGRREEPVFLPAKLPVVLMLGTEGIAVGMTTKIMPHNLGELLKAQIAYLRGEKFTLLPDFPQGGAMDAGEYADGRGKVKLRATIEAVDDKTVVIREVAAGTTTESLIASIESAIQKGKVKITSIDDFTADKVELQVTLARGAYAEEVIPQLYAYTDCEVSQSSNVVVVQNRHPVEVTVSEILAALTEQLRGQIKAELEHEMVRLENRQHALVLEQVFIEEKLYKRIEAADTMDKVSEVVRRGMQAHAARFVRPLSGEDVTRLLDLKIRRISAFDIESNRKEIDDVRKAVANCQNKLKNLTKTTIAYLEDLHRRYAHQFPRRTKIKKFVAIDRKAVANQNIKLGYDEETGFFGSDVKSSASEAITVSEYDLVLAISEHGTFRVMTAQPKVLLGRVLYLERFDPEVAEEFILVYKDSKKMAYAKRIVIDKFVRNREYRLVADEGGKIEALLRVGDAKKVRFSYQPGARQRVVEGEFALKELEVVKTSAKGVKLAPKPVGRLSVVR